MMSTDREVEMDACLAYEVLRHPDEWLGYPSTKLLRGFLQGADIRASYVQPQFPQWRISGVLNDPAFYQQFVDATGHSALSIIWDTAIAMTHFSLAAGFSKLKEKALAWHRLNGVVISKDETQSPNDRIDDDVDRFWSGFAHRPAMYMGDATGWMLYCFLQGMNRGGDWLGLPKMPRLCEVFGGITRRSEESYGSPFAAFRIYDAKQLLEWVGLCADTQ